MKRAATETILGSVVEKPLLRLHAAARLEPFWIAVQRVIEAVAAWFPGRSDATAPSNFSAYRQMVATDFERLLQCPVNRDLSEQASSQPPVCPRQ